MTPEGLVEGARSRPRCSCRTRARPAGCAASREPPLSPFPARGAAARAPAGSGRTRSGLRNVEPLLRARSEGTGRANTRTSPRGASRARGGRERRRRPWERRRFRSRSRRARESGSSRPVRRRAFSARPRNRRRAVVPCQEEERPSGRLPVEPEWNASSSPSRRTRPSATSRESGPFRWP